ncbi:MAG TPA: oxidoreductase [Bacteroidetes bacterium]|nr:oxidoreductase [Bacteroidota bacterium]
MDRRNFFKSAALGASGVMMGKTVLASSASQTEGKLVYRTLGRTGLQIPVVSMGVMRADNPNLVRAALEKGVTLFDTAHGYQRGNNERMLGEVLQDYPRDSFIVGTKVGPTGKDRQTGDLTSDTDPEEFERMFHISLERLQMDYVDILHVHGLSSRQSVTFEPLLKKLEQIKQEGKARFIGFSTHQNMPEVIDEAAESGFYDVVLTSYNFQMADWKEMNHALEKAAAAGIGLIAMKTMAGAFFDNDRTQPINVKAALKWALLNPNIHTSIPGYTSFNELEESFSVMENLHLSDDEMKDLRLAQHEASLFCLGCNDCLGQCSKGLSIPDLMRGYMYTYGYRAYAEARELVASLDLPSEPCSDCAECTVTCRRGYQVAERISRVARWKDVPADLFIA